VLYWTKERAQEGVKVLLLANLWKDRHKTAQERRESVLPCNAMALAQVRIF